MSETDRETTTQLEAAAFRRLIEHLRQRTDVQNIDLMNLAGFCRNCLSNWYQEAAAERGIALGKDEVREIIYGMPYKEWQERHQSEASPQAQISHTTAKRDHDSNPAKHVAPAPTTASAMATTMSSRAKRHMPKSVNSGL